MQLKKGDIVYLKEPLETECEIKMEVISCDEKLVYVKVNADFGWVCNSHISQDELLKA